ncbi:MAG: RNA polymerase Rpb4 family protein [Candidatus Diapherotrites archaeon]
MIGKRVNSSEEIPIYKVKEILKEKSNEGELSYEQNLTYEYVKKFARVSPAKAEKLLGDLNKIEGMDKKTALKIVDTIPQDMERLRVLIPKDSSLDEAKQKEILELVAKQSRK